MAERRMSEGQRAYEAKRAAKAGVSLERWLTMKEREAREAEAAEARARKAAESASAPARKPGFLSRLLERAQKPL